MSTFAGQLKEEDIHGIAEYFSALDPGLGTAKAQH
jgi:cytochrome c553